MLTMCLPALEQKLHTDAHPATSRDFSWLSYVQQRIPKCSFPLQAWEKCAPNEYSRVRIGVKTLLFISGKYH